MAGTAFASHDSIPNQVVRVDLANGRLQPFVQNLQTAKGLLYLDAAGAEPALPLASAANGAANPSGAGASPAAVAPGHAGADGDAVPIVLAGLALVIALGGGAIALSRRRPASA